MIVDKIEQEIRSEMKKPRLRLDQVKEQLIAITKLYERIANSMIYTVEKWCKKLIPSSTDYNKFLSYSQRDLNMISSSQQDILNELLVSWNSIEQSIPKINEKEEYNLDTKYITEFESGSVVNDLILNIKDSISAIPNLKNNPELTSTVNSDILGIYYGKAYGAWIEGNESGEDGIRPDNTDTSTLIDGEDTFLESEVTILTNERNETQYFTNIIDIEPELSTVIRVVFSSPTNINYFKIVPNSFGTDAYYKMTRIRGSTGINQVELYNDEILVNKETTITFDTYKLTSLYIMLVQTRGYYEKYTLGRYKLGVNNKWIDITGPDVLSRVKKNGKDINTAITEEIKNIGSWISDLWLPNAKYKEEAVLDKSYGKDGYVVVNSSDSNRKRFAIGITDIDFGLNDYVDTSEHVTELITMPDGTSGISLDLSKKVPEGSEILSYISFDNNNWLRINPIGNDDIIDDNLLLVPKTYYINSDLSSERKKHSDTGDKAFINTKLKQFRLRFVLKKDQDMIDTPRITNYTPIYEVQE